MAQAKKKTKKTQKKSAKKSRTKKAEPLPLRKAPEDEPGAMKGALDVSSEKNRNQFFAFLAFLIYSAIAVGGTTDAMLLRGQQILLPLLNIPIPLMGFYFFLPILVLAFHFNMLFNLLQHRRKLFTWREQVAKGLGGGEHRGDEADRRKSSGRILLFPYIFNYLGDDKRDDVNQTLVRVFLVFFFLVLPLALLCLIQWRFSTYHSAWMTFWHFFLVGLDVIILSVYWHRVSDERYLGEKHDGSEFFWRYHLDKKYRRWYLSFLRPFSLLGGFFIEFLNFILLIVFIFFPGTKKFKATVRGIFETLPSIGNFKGHAFFGLISLAIYLSLLNFLALKYIQVKDGLTKQDTLTKVLMVIVPSVEVPEMDFSPKGPSETVRKFHKYLKRDELESYVKSSRGLDLRGRDLRLADMRNVVLIKADLRRADLSGADLSGANMPLAELGNTNLVAANLVFANFEAANLGFANLAASNLWNANLSAAMLVGVNLSAANLREANLLAAHLSSAQLLCADLSNANLSGADLRAADLSMANLKNANLIAANLEDTNLFAAFLGGTNLSAANMAGSNLFGIFRIKSFLSDTLLPVIPEYKNNENRALLQKRIIHSIPDSVRWHQLDYRTYITPSRSYQDYITENMIKPARERVRNFKEVEVTKLIPRNFNREGFLDVRRSLSCQERFIAENIIRAKWKIEEVRGQLKPEDMQANIRTHMKKTCPEVYNSLPEYIRKKE